MGVNSTRLIDAFREQRLDPVGHALLQLGAFAGDGEETAGFVDYHK
jgi:hypothetical protein